MSYLNTLSPLHPRKDNKRVGRGIGSGKGKTCGRGHKGQKARAGGFHKVGFEGGQMPIQRRLPKFGFTSRKQEYVAQLRSSVLNSIQQETITLDLLKLLGLVQYKIKQVKIFFHGEVTSSVKLKGIRVTSSVKAMIEKAGGSVE
ncbi:MAG: 50S ribosomal protein L15 [Gammaproteobacteria bacterium]|nr:50S ribosomal protein L15 [Gammaproteobacteria bacterium]MCD8542558.1 50S ribosomal protein L15 [Gammaproteobacteria bacterium]